MDITQRDGDTDRAAFYGQDVAKWLKAHKALATKRNRGQRIAEVTIKNAANEAYFAARLAARSALRVLGEAPRYQHAACHLCGVDCSTHPDAGNPLASCGDCGRPTCPDHRVDDAATRCNECAEVFYR